MNHWSDRFVGRPYVENEFECGDLAVLVAREVFRREVSLPAGRLPGAFGRERMIAEHRDEFVRQITAGEVVEGDLALIQTRGYNQHIGVICDIAGERWVMHNLSIESDGRVVGGQVIRQRLREMARWGYGIEGFYRWI